MVCSNTIIFSTAKVCSYDGGWVGSVGKAEGRDDLPPKGLGDSC